MESPKKNIKGENGMSITFPKFTETELSKSNSNNTTSFGFTKFDIFDTDSSIISEFMSLSLNVKIEKFKSNPSLRKLKDKNSLNTFLHYICMNDDNFPMMTIIKPTNKEINRQNNFGQTSLHIAIINKSDNITKYLIENGADLNISDNNLNNSLHFAVINNNIKIIKFLLEYKANPLFVNKNNETVLDIAIKMDFKECINLLKEDSLMKGKNNLDNKDENLLNLKNQIIEKETKINGNYSNNKKTIDNIIINNIFSPKKIHYNKNKNNITSTPKNGKNTETFTRNISLYKKNIFLTSKKKKQRQRTNSTTTINFFPRHDKIYAKKIVIRSKSISNENNYQIQTHEPKKQKEENDNENIISIQNDPPRKTDFIIQKEVFLDSDNESIEEEESVIRDNISGNNEKKIEKILESFTSLKTIKITPLTQTDNKINPYLQVDSFVSALHKDRKNISDSNGNTNDDELIIVEPSISLTNNNTNNINKNMFNNNQIQNNELTEIKKINKEIKDPKEDLYKFLEKIEMEQYIDLFINEGFDDINLVINQIKKGNPINDDILREMGIERPGDRAKILIRIQECARLFDFKIPFEAVYYINRKKFEFLKYDFHVKALQNWLKKMKLQHYLDKFYNNGYYSPELIFIQKASNFPINDTIIERDLKIENINDRKLIMSSITSNSKSYVSDLQKKYKNNKNENISNNAKDEDEVINCLIF